MSVKKFKFISPGVFINEIDNSALPDTPTAIGPLVIGQTRRGPAMRPIRVESFSDFIDKFGTPVPGQAPQDVWRNGAGIVTSPSYASYAAQAWLQNSSPINVVRLLGAEHPEATSAGYAGWQTDKEVSTDQTLANQGGAFGLFIFASGSTDKTNAVNTSPSTGALAAIIYCNSAAAVRLSGNMRLDDNSKTTSSAALPIFSTGNNHQFELEIISGSGAGTAERITINFDRNSPNYIRKALNTNPTAINADIATSPKAYFLGETYDQFLQDTVGTGGASGAAAGHGASLGIIYQLQTDAGAIAYGNRRFAHRPARSGWVFSQHLGAYANFEAASQNKLFKIHSRGAGTYEMHNLKLSIEDIKAPRNDANPYSTFTLSVRKLSDSDGKVQEVERFANLNLNPGSPNFIANRIGDKFIEFDTVERRNKEYGKFDNQSEFIRVEMHPDVEDSGPEDPSVVPFGFFGPPRFKGFSIIDAARSSGKFLKFGTVDGAGGAGVQLDTAGVDGVPVLSPAVNRYHQINTSNLMEDGQGAEGLTASFLFPTIALRLSSSDDALANAGQARHGFRTARPSSQIHDESVVDLLRSLPDRLLNGASPAIFSDYDNLPANLEIPVVFSLDDVVSGSTEANVTSHFYASGSRARGHSISSDTDGHTKGSVTKTGWEATILYGVDSFTLPLFGGADGLDITEKNPFGGHVISPGGTSGAETTNYAYNTVKQAMDIVSDVEEVEYNVITAPNITEPTLTQHMVDIAEDRGDALALIDIQDDFTPAQESKSSFKNRVGDVDSAIKKMKDRNMDSSFGAAYYPYVQIVDRFTNSKLFVPPTVAALGVLSNSERIANVWFAPAGFNRGGLSQGAAGIPVVNVAQKLTRKNRDGLYEIGVNPIASFPSEGLVVFGQKTLQANPSALDRINVRRLLILIKKQISRIANRILFDQNARVTWNRFTSAVEPFLRGVQAGFGLEDFRVVLDETTTTPDLIDRNILYAKIFLKPTKSIEFIAIDFNITNQGAAFDD